MDATTRAAEGEMSMGVYIKNMEMPTSCDECEFCTCYVREDGTEENYRCVITFYPIHEFDERHEYCPLVEIPPHGRLIDADEFIAEQRHLYCENCERRKGMKNGKVKFVYDMGDAPCRSCRYGDVLEDLDDAPTIIESTIGQLNSDSAVNKANANTSNALNALDCVGESEASR